MTSTSVKAVNSMMKTFTVNAGSAKSVGTSSFQDIWNQQTDKNPAADMSSSENKKAVSTLENAQRGEALSRKKLQDAQREKMSADDGSSVEDVCKSEVDEQKLEEAMAVLGTGVAELMQEIAGAFDMSLEELEQLMAEMNMDAMDMLDAQKFSALLLEAGGAADSLALLTDEELCGKFQMLMDRQKEMLSDISEQLQMPSEQIVRISEEMERFKAAEENPMTANQEPDENLQQGSTAEDGIEEVFDGAVGRADTAVKTDTKQQTGKESDREGDTAGNQGGNLLLQNLKADSMKPEVQQVPDRTSAWSETTRDIMNQIMDYMRVQLKADTSSLEMQLHPASLGTLQVNVASKGGVLTASFVTQNETVKAVLESQMIQLKESFDEQGVKVEAIEVTVQTHQFERNLDQGRGRQQNEPEKKVRPRRINLGAALDLEEELTQEEQLAAEIMTANGSTVDYTA